MIPAVANNAGYLRRLQGRCSGPPCHLEAAAPAMRVARKDAAPICTARDDTAAMRSARKHAVAAIHTARDAVKRERRSSEGPGATDVLVPEPQP